MTKKKTVVKHPAALDQWLDNFKASTMRVGFCLSLTRPMLEFLCAVADDVSWDRATHGSSRAVPDNWIAVERALVKRGLIARKSQREIDTRVRTPPQEDMFYEWSHCQLTRAGKHVVELVKLTGLFIEADAAINKRSRRA